MQYVKNYVSLIGNIKDILQVRRQATVEKSKLTIEQAATVAQDLHLHCIYNRVLKLYYFRKNRYSKLTANETFIH